MCGDGAQLYDVHVGDKGLLKEEEERRKKKGILVCTKLPSAVGGPKVVKDV